MTLGESPVHGYLLTLADPTVLSILDGLEDYDPNRMAEENEYNRQQIEIYDLSGQPLGLAWVYLMTSKLVQRLGGILIPSGWWSSSINTSTS
jgi:gamma-glutamylcyclotransferase (GGCT)/AIG2-like uncharacterized protein YtfP